MIHSFDLIDFIAKYLLPEEDDDTLALFFEGATIWWYNNFNSSKSGKTPHVYELNSMNSCSQLQ